jgi:2-methylcitrate dehydratase PrpD
LASKVDLVAGEKWEALYPQKRGATVTIIEKSGRSLSAVVELAKGEPENPASWEELQQKFRSNVSLLMSSGECVALTNLVKNLENISLAEFVAAFLN